jgi:hypothetical protein
MLLLLLLLLLRVQLHAQQAPTARPIHSYFMCSCQQCLLQLLLC